MHCQQFTLKYITLPYQTLQAKPVLPPGLISKYYSEFVTNAQMFLQSRAPHVEFASQPEHETSSDSGIQLLNDRLCIQVKKTTKKFIATFCP